MERHGISDTDVRRYFLGDLNEVELETFEQQFFLQPDMEEVVSLSEHDLVEDYVRQQLSEEERNRFEKYYLCSQERQQRVEFMTSLIEAAKLIESSEPFVKTKLKPQKFWADRFLAFFGNPAFGLASAGAIVLLVIGGTWSFRVQHHRSREHTEQLEIAMTQRNSEIERLTEALKTKRNDGATVSGPQFDRVSEKLRNTLAKERAERAKLETQLARPYFVSPQTIATTLIVRPGALPLASMANIPVVSIPPLREPVRGLLPSRFPWTVEFHVGLALVKPAESYTLEFAKGEEVIKIMKDIRPDVDSPENLRLEMPIAELTPGVYTITVLPPRGPAAGSLRFRIDIEP